MIVTPELNGSCSLAQAGHLAPCAKAGGLADVATLLVDELSGRGFDVRVVMPYFRSLFQKQRGSHSRRLHLCPDREFFYRSSVYEGCADSNLRGALAFQRDVIHQVIPRVRPDLIHCHDWMTALVPAAAKSMGIPSLFTLHNLHNAHCDLATIEDRGIDAAAFWSNLHYERFPNSYEQSRVGNPVNFLASAIHASDQVNTVSPSFMRELIDGQHEAGRNLHPVLIGKNRFGAASGIVNAPDPSYSPEVDLAIAKTYGASDQAEGKRINKRVMQEALGLEIDPDAPLLFWPSRLDPVQKGCDLFSEILYQLVSDYWGLGLQVVFVADGPFQEHFRHIRDFHGLANRIAVRDFSEALSRQAYAASDFTLVPSAYEPCGLAQMVALRYGSLPIVHRTGGLRDTVSHWWPGERHGNGFVFEVHDCGGLRWAIDEAIRFQILPPAERQVEIRRIMEESHFDPSHTTEQYVRLYESILDS